MTTLDVDAIALFDETHPGHGAEALAAALAECAKAGISVHHPASYFGRWTRERRAAIKIPPPARAACEICAGTGWAYDEANDPVTVTWCTACRPDKAAG